MPKTRRGGENVAPSGFVMANNEIIQEKRDEMVALYASGMSSRKVAALVGVEKSTVIAEVKRRGETIVPARFTSPIPQHQRDAMVMAYRTGASCESAAKAFGYSGKACVNALKDAGVPIRALGAKATQAQKDAMVEAYLKGESSGIIAERFGFSAQPLYTELKKRGIPRRKIHDRPYKRALSAPQVQEAILRNNAGENVTSIGRSFGVHGNTVAKEIRRTGADIFLTKTMLTKEQKREVVVRYEAGESSVKLSKVFGIRPDSIRDVLKRRGAKCRPPVNAQERKLSNEEECAVAGAYLLGTSVAKVAARFGVRTGTVRGILRRGNVAMRKPSEYERPLTFLEPDQQVDVCKAYEEGRGCPSIAKAFGVGETTIVSCLRRHGVPRRAPNTEEYRKALSAAHQGISVQDWQGFSSGWRQQVCQTSDYKRWKISVLTRDGFCCQLCGTKKGPFDGHHIHKVATSRERVYDVANGITLCKPCHHKIAAKEESFAAHFEALIQGKIVPKINLGPTINSEEVVEAYLAGETISSICQKYKTSFQRVVGVLTRAGAYKGRSKKLSRNLVK